MRVRITVVPTLPADVLPLARLAESTGIDGIGIADSPALHGPCYPTVQHVLAGTDTLSVGPVVVNPVTQHPSGHAATLWALRSLAPGRVFAGVGTGDSAVSSVGLAPAGPDQLADCVTTIRQRVPSVPVLVAIGGGRAAARVPPAATGVILGGGLDPEWLGHLVGLADRSAGHRLQRWAFVIASLDDALRPERRRAEVLGSVLTVARHSLAGDLARK
ncbi:MAG TPA: LLM class flavin-dependent oxidoreductase, partial [Micromonospora sp.]